jgi:DHA1 family bicyclomycin/chloramphenicol resistance-like MFS transporter
VLLLAALGALGPLSIDMYLPALPGIGSDIGSGPGAAQTSLAAYFAGLAVGQLVIGPLSDRLGRIRPLTWGLILYVLGCLGSAVASDIWQLNLWRFVQAFGGSAAMVIPRALIRDQQTGNAAARTASLLALVGSCAPVVAPLLGGVLLTWSGWRSIFSLLALVGAALALTVPRALRLRAAARPDPRPSAPREPVLPALQALLRDRAFLAYAGGAACSSAAMFAYITGSPFVIITLYHIPPSHFGWFFAINVLAMIGASQLNRFLLRTVPLTRVVRWAGLGGALAGLWLVACAGSGFGGLWGIVGGSFLIMASLGFIGINAGILALEAHGGRAGMAAALMGALQFSVSAGGSWATNALYDGTARPMALVMASMISVAAVLIFAARSHHPLRHS